MYLLQELTWRVGPARELTWHEGPQRGCDAALRPRGRAMGGSREAQVAHRAWTRGRRPRVSTRVHADAPEGRHVAGKVGRWRTHGYSGPWRDYVPTRFYDAGDMAPQRTSDAIAKRRDSSIAWTRVHAITNQSTCAIYELSDSDQ